jgi:pseudouridylate synthase
MKINYSEEVAAALRDGRPVVALESTVIAHGLPHPQNLETAFRIERVVRENGAIPATVAIFSGEFKVGLTASDMERLATDGTVRKVSRRDLSIAIAKKLDCATTVSTTAFIAHRAGMQVFATGGIGGVHRGTPLDVSADLPELARTPITVVCSGAKIVLDLAATREWLETYGITVLGWRCDEMPAFYSGKSGLRVDQRVESAADVAAIADTRSQLGLGEAILLTVPVPGEHEIASEELESFLEDALRIGFERGVTGKEITPFLLSEMSRLSEGRTLAANIALLEKNAEVAACVAVEIPGPRPSGAT